MQIRYLTDTEKKTSRELWEEAFSEDSRSFVDYYYTEKIRGNRILAVPETDGKIAAMVQQNPYAVRADSRVWKIDYLVGVATRIKRRHQGYMRALLMKMMKDMRREDVPFCFLMPADPAIYRPFGFAYIYDQPQWKLTADAERILQRKELIPERAGDPEYYGLLHDAAEWLDNWLRRCFRVSTVRDTQYLLNQVHEIASENGCLQVLFHDGEIVGLLSEWGWEKREQRFLYAEDKYMEPAAASRPAIMARIISPAILAPVICLNSSVQEEELTIRLRLHDPLIPENDGAWIWRLRKEDSVMEPDNESNTDHADLELTVPELTQWLFGYREPEQAAGFAEKIQTLGRIFLDEVV